MAKGGSERRSLPHNPGVRDLVEEKRRTSSPPRRDNAILGFRGWHERGYLPHTDEPGLKQFVTFSLIDAIPKNRQAECMSALSDERERRKALEDYLDAGRGECWLRHADIGHLVDQTIRFYDGKRYELLAWVVMPNHVHLLIKLQNTSLSGIVADLKRYTAREANKVLGRTGPFWAADYWDTYMRDEAHELRTRRYIENNPTKAFLVPDPTQWPWSSARFRNEYGALCLPATDLSAATGDPNTPLP